MTLPIPEKFLFFFLAMPLGMQDLSSLTRDQTQALAVKVLTTGPPQISQHLSFCHL